MSTLICAGCPNTKLPAVDFLHCSRCPDKYHYACVNFSKKDFDNLDQKLKITWVCPSCRCKELKRGVSTSTPVRSLVAASTTDAQKVESEQKLTPFENVTLRSKSRSTGSCGCLSADVIREIIREELDRKFDTDIQNIHIKIDKLEESLAISNSERDIIKIEANSQKALIVQLQKENDDLRTTTYDLSNRLRQQEQLSRANNIEIQCVPEHSSENLYTTVQQLGSAIKCPLTDTDLQYCSRIAKLNSASSRPRSILVKFSSRRLRDTFLAGVIKHNKNNPGDKLNTSHLGYGGNKRTAVFVSEHLTLEAKALHAAARQKARQLNFRFVWVRDGKVFLRKTDTSTFILVKDQSVLDNLA